jgi:hypothetical protein
MILRFGRNVTLICALDVGDKVKTDNWGYQLDNMVHTVTNVERSNRCASGFLVTIDGYENPLDSGWLIKVGCEQTTLDFI